MSEQDVGTLETVSNSMQVELTCRKRARKPFNVLVGLDMNNRDMPPKIFPILDLLAALRPITNKGRVMPSSVLCKKMLLVKRGWWLALVANVRVSCSGSQSAIWSRESGVAF
jgi:hypothetical protein